jgi:hypothetical protein
VRKPIAALAVVLLSSAGLTAVQTSSLASPSESSATGALLVTGDRITAQPSPDGRRAITVQPAADKGLGRAMVQLSRGTKSYVIPAAALPYLGRGLDWNLFDVDAVLQAQQNKQPTPQAVSAAKEFGAGLVSRFLDDRRRRQPRRRRSCSRRP